MVKFSYRKFTWKILVFKYAHWNCAKFFLRIIDATTTVTKRCTESCIISLLNYMHKNCLFLKCLATMHKCRLCTIVKKKKTVVYTAILYFIRPFIIEISHRRYFPRQKCPKSDYIYWFLKHFVCVCVCVCWYYLTTNKLVFWCADLFIECQGHFKTILDNQNIVGTTFLTTDQITFTNYLCVKKVRQKINLNVIHWSLFEGFFAIFFFLFLQT